MVGKFFRGREAEAGKENENELVSLDRATCVLFGYFA